VQQLAQRGAARIGTARHGTARHGENTAFLIVALRIFGREVFNGQLPSNAVTIHVTIFKHHMSNIYIGTNYIFLTISPTYAQNKENHKRIPHCGIHNVLKYSV
jgi:hypothetical protein